MESFIDTLLQIFPEACPQYIQRICEGKVAGPGVLDELISQILEGDYPKRENVENAAPKANTDQLEILTQILPGRDLNYLRTQFDKRGDKPDKLANFIENELHAEKLDDLKKILPDADSEYPRVSCSYLLDKPDELGRLTEQEMGGIKLEVLKEVLPSEDPDYLQTHYNRLINNPHELQMFIEHKMNAEQQLEMLQQILPEADPNYLRFHCDRLLDEPNELRAFISNAIETRNYPTLKDYLRKQKISAQQRNYTTEFSVKNFLEVLPDPVTHFEDPKRKPVVLSDECRHYVLCFLKNHFRRVSLHTIRRNVKQNSENLLTVYKNLEKISATSTAKTLRRMTPMPDLLQNIPLLQEIAYIQHCDEIKSYFADQKAKEANERNEARLAGLLLTCPCCFDEEVMPKDVYRCENDCIFCKECVRKGAEVAYGYGKLNFLCLNDCSSHFSLLTLQAVLDPKIFSKIVIKKQFEEVKAAGIEDLETCPFCDFAAIPAQDDKIFRCLNPECMQESCRLCKEPSHLPLRCDEIEKSDEVKIRTYIENKMTEALLRQCYRCGKKYIKTTGCNHITCTCGAQMCYVCGKPYNQHCGCSMNISSKHLHLSDVLQGAEAAKREMGVDVDPKKLKIDPTLDVRQHYHDEP